MGGFNKNASPRFTSHQLDTLRRIELTQILKRCGCTPHRLDKKKWHTPMGTISVNGMKFMNWSTGKGGGGAIDLVCHIKGDHFKQAVLWLIDNFDPIITPEQPHTSFLSQPDQHPPFQPPTASLRNIHRIKHYLCYTRALPQGKRIWNLPRQNFT